MKVLFIMIISAFSLNVRAQFMSQQGFVLNLNYNLENTTPQPFALTFKNTGSSVASLPAATGSGVGVFKISLNRCVNVAPNKTCQISYAPPRNIALGTYVFMLSGMEINYQVVRQDANGPIVFQPVENLQISPSSIDPIQFATEEKKKIISVSIKNSGNVSSFISMNSSSPVKIFLNRCVSSILPNKTCKIFFYIPNPGSDNTINYSLSFSINNQVKQSLSFISKGEATQLQTLFAISPSQINAPPESSGIVGGGAFSGWRIIASPVYFNRDVIVKKITMRIGKYGDSNVKAKMIIAQNVLGEVGSVLYESSNQIDTITEIPEGVKLPISFNFENAELPSGNYYIFIADEFFPSSNEIPSLKINSEFFGDAPIANFKSSLNNGVLFSQTFSSVNLYPPTIIEGF